MVAANRLDLAIMEEHDMVAQAKCRNPVRQEDHRFSRQYPAESVIEQCLRIVVELDGRFLDDVQRRIAQDSPCQCDAKLFSDPQRMAELADVSFVAVG